MKNRRRNGETAGKNGKLDGKSRKAELFQKICFPRELKQIDANLLTHTSAIKKVTSKKSPLQIFADIVYCKKKVGFVNFTAIQEEK
jgi:hypothetical protein